MTEKGFQPGQPDKDLRRGEETGGHMNGGLIRTIKVLGPGRSLGKRVQV